MKDANSKHSTAYEEITLKDLIEKGNLYYKEVRNNWKIIALLIVLFTSIFLFNAIRAGKTFAASKTFLINQESGGNMGGLSSIFGSFNLGGGLNESNPERIIELSKSMRIIQSSIFTKASLRGKNDYLANHIIKMYDFHDKWSDDTTGLKDFLFTNTKTEEFNRQEKIALKAVYGKIRGSPKKGIKGIIATSYDDVTGIIEMVAETKASSISVAILASIYTSLSEFYVNKMTEKPLKTYQNLSNKVDSLRNLLSSLEYALANELDTNQGLITRKAMLKRAQLERKVQVAYIAYGEAIKNFEIAEFSLKNATPFFQIIDEPILPLTAIRESKIKAIILGIFMGGFLAVAFIVARRLLRDTMS